MCGSRRLRMSSDGIEKRIWQKITELFKFPADNARSPPHKRPLRFILCLLADFFVKLFTNTLSQQATAVKFQASDIVAIA